MTTALKIIMVIIAAYVGTMWPVAWTSLLLLLALSAMFMGMAIDMHFARRERAARPTRRMTNRIA